VVAVLPQVFLMVSAVAVVELLEPAAAVTVAMAAVVAVAVAIPVASTVAILVTAAVVEEEPTNPGLMVLEVYPNLAVMAALAEIVVRVPG
jgi:hypothetical protein